MKLKFIGEVDETRYKPDGYRLDDIIISFVDDDELYEILGDLEFDYEDSDESKIAILIINYDKLAHIYLIQDFRADIEKAISKAI